MEDKDKLFEANKNDNTKRVMLSTICVLLLVVIVFCVYLLFFYNKDDAGDTSSVPDTTSLVPAITTSEPPYSQPADSSDDQSVTEPSSQVEQSEEPSSEEPSEPSSKEPDESSEPDTSDDTSEPSGELEYQWYGYVYRFRNHAIEDFTPGANSKQSYIDAINALYNAIGKDKNFYHMVIPTQVEYLRSYFPKEVTSSTGDGFYSQSQAKFIQLVAENTVEGVKNIDVTNLFDEKYDAGEYLYFNTDKNYTALGAYYAYTAFCEQAGLTPVALDSLTEYVNERFLGSFYTSTRSETLANNPDRVVFYDLDEAYPADVSIYSGTSVFKRQQMIYKDVSSVANGYNAFFGREAYRIEVEVKSPASDKSILVIGDLSAAPFAPYLAANYKNITFINATCFNDKYYVPITEFVKDKNYDDVLVMSYSTSYKSPFFFSTKLTEMLGE